MHQNNTFRRLYLLALASATLAGCSAVGPDFKAPDTAPADRYTRAPMATATASTQIPLGASQSFVEGAPVASDWWTAFGSQKLDDLVSQALHNSPTLEAAEATLRQAQQTYAAQAGSTLYPTVDGKLGASRSQTNGSGMGQRNIPQNVYNLYNAGISVSYGLDLFGGNRRALESLAAQADYQRYQLAAARLTLAGNIVTAAITQAQQAAQIEATRAIIQAQQTQLDIARKRFALGATAKLDVLSLQSQVEQVRAGLPVLESNLAKTNHLLAVLLGEAPGAVDLPQFRLTDFTLPAQLPVTVPSELLKQRPDIQASTALLHTATADYGVAVAKLYPQISLSGNLGSQALTTGALFGPGSIIWSVAGQLAQPLFNAGLRSGTNAAEASLQAAGANYRQTVLNAFRNVADVLKQLDGDALALAAQAEADSAARTSLSLVEQQNGLGAASYLQLLTAQQQAQQTRLLLISAQAARLTDTAALFQAMGGGILEAPAATASAAH